MSLFSWLGNEQRSMDIGENWAERVIAGAVEIDDELVGELAEDYSPHPEAFANSFYSTVDSTPTKDGLLGGIRNWFS